MKQPSMWQRALSAFGLLAVLSAFLFAFSVRPAAAAIGIVVNTAADGAPAVDGYCTLREAIIAANNDAGSGAATGECATGSGATPSLSLPTTPLPCRQPVPGGHMPK